MSRLFIDALERYLSDGVGIMDCPVRESAISKIAMIPLIIITPRTAYKYTISCYLPLNEVVLSDDAHKPKALDPSAPEGGQRHVHSVEPFSVYSSH